MPSTIFIGRSSGNSLQKQANEKAVAEAAIFIRKNLMKKLCLHYFYNKTMCKKYERIVTEL